MFNKLTKRIIASLAESTNISVNGKEFFGDSVELDDQFVTVHTTDTKPSKHNKMFVGNQQELEIIIHGNVNEVTTNSGNVKCHDVLGNVTVDAGNVKCDNVGGNIKVDAGNINAKKIRGNVKTDIGNISING